MENLNSALRDMEHTSLSRVYTSDSEVHTAMDVLPLNFRTLTYLGLWFEDVSSFVNLRRCWGLLIAGNIFYFTFTEVIEFYLLRNDVKELVDVMFLTVTYILLCLKIVNFSLRRDGLVKVLENLRNEICYAVTVEEEEILAKYSSKARKIFQNILVLSQSTGVFFCVLPFMTLQPEDYVLPFKTYQFYNETTVKGFSITVVIQFAALVFGIFINVSMDTMTYGFIILATSQFELISYRFVKAVAEKNVALLNQCVMHYGHIDETVRNIQHCFIGVIAPLFFFSLLTLCASIFQMSQNSIISLEFLGFAMYLSCMLCQVFLYCWYGNELKLKSQELVINVYGSDWTSLDPKDKKKLHILMITANKGVDISWRGQCSLSLNTFVWIIKTSYTAFNLLQRVSDE